MVASLDSVQLLHAFLHACISLFINPLFYVGSLLLVYELIRNAKAERKFFGVRLTRVKRPIIRQVLLGLLMGLVLSVVLCLVGAVVTSLEIWMISGIALIAAGLRLRFLYLPYAVGVLLAAQLVTNYIPEPTSAMGKEIWTVVHGFHTTSWLALAAGASLMNALLLRMSRNRAAAPASVIGKRGGALGAFVVQLAFLSAVVLPVAGHDIGSVSLPVQWPLLYSLAGGLTISAVPVFTGISSVFLTRRPDRGIRATYRFYLLTGIVLAGCTYLTYRFQEIGAAVGILLCIVVHEFFLWGMSRREFNQDPLFGESPEGVKVLSTIRGSVAQQMELLPGEVITHVNQVPVHTMYDLHFAFEQNPAYAKLQVLDLRGEARFVGKPVFEGERHQLGLIFAPDTNDRVGYIPFKAGLLQSMYAKVFTSSVNSARSWSDAQVQTPSE